MSTKTNEMIQLFQDAGEVLVAFSGGVDSSLLLALAQQALGDRALAVTVRSPLHPAIETTEAEKLASHMGARHMIIEIDELEVAEICQNTPQRCYYCKRLRFSKLCQLAQELHIGQVMEGSNTDDLKDYRPGRKAVEELGIRSPFLELGWSKAKIRTLAHEMKLDNWNKPAASCLASRIPYGTSLTRESLDRIRRAEGAVASLGFSDFRVRDHGPVARLELHPDSFAKILEPETRGRVINALRRLGYKFIALDMQGYRTGAMNEVLDLDAD